LRLEAERELGATLDDTSEDAAGVGALDDTSEDAAGVGALDDTSEDAAGVGALDRSRWASRSDAG